MDPELARLRRRTADVVSGLAELPVGPVLVSALHKLRGAPMTAETAVEVHTLWGKTIAWATAQQMIATSDALTGVRGRLELPAGEAAVLTAQEVACMTHVPFATAMSHVALVDRVADCQPASWVALDRGELSLQHLKAIERATRNCCPRIATAVDEQVVPLAVRRGWTPSETTRAAQRLVIALDPEGADDRAAAAKDQSDVQLYPLPDEVGNLSATGDAVRTRAIYETVNDRAEAMGRAGDDRPVGLRRFDALYDLVTGAVVRNGSRRGTTLVRIDLATLLGVNEHPGELDGYGPITAGTARRIAADTTLRRLVTDPLTGEGRQLPNRSARGRNAVCIPTTRDVEGFAERRKERAAASDSRGADASTSRPCPARQQRDGRAPVHHQLKTKKLWRVDVNPDGSETWTSYLGFTHTKQPAYFPMPEPLAPEADLPEPVANRLPQAFDPDPPYPDEPLPEPPPLGLEEYQEMERALDLVNAFGETFLQWCDRHYDEARTVGLVA